MKRKSFMLLVCLTRVHMSLILLLICPEYAALALKYDARSTNQSYTSDIGWIK